MGKQWLTDKYSGSRKTGFQQEESYDVERAEGLQEGCCFEAPGGILEERDIESAEGKQHGGCWSKCNVLREKRNYRQYSLCLL